MRSMVRPSAGDRPRFARRHPGSYTDLAMFPSFRAFMSGIIDYAGLFPPAKLPLEEAFRNYVRYRREADAWMLGRFVCPAARLKELSTGDLATPGPRISFSALARNAEFADFTEGLRADLRDISEFTAAHSRVLVDVL